MSSLARMLSNSPLGRFLIPLAVEERAAGCRTLDVPTAETAETWNASLPPSTAETATEAESFNVDSASARWFGRRDELRTVRWARADSGPRVGLNEKMSENACTHSSQPTSTSSK